MFRGTFFIIVACFIWGLIYVVPEFMPAFNSLEVALGRYALYGIISLLYMLIFRFKALCDFPLDLWKKAIWFGLIANVGFYPAAVLSMRYAHPAITVLISGIGPISIAFYGNWKQQECSFKQLLWPCIAMLAGLVLANLPAISQSSVEGSLSLYLLGLFFGIIALATWTLYAVANGRLFKQHPTLNPCDWCSIMGIATLGWVLVFIGLVFPFLDESYIYKYTVWTPELQVFLLGSLVLGVLCSWFAFYLWNKGSLVLPVSLAGQLTIFETLFGLLFVYTLEQRLPQSIEFLGILMMLGSISLSLYLFKEQESLPLPQTSESSINYY